MYFCDNTSVAADASSLTLIPSLSPAPLMLLSTFLTLTHYYCRRRRRRRRLRLRLLLRLRLPVSDNSYRNSRTAHSLSLSLSLSLIVPSLPLSRSCLSHPFLCPSSLSAVSEAVREGEGPLRRALMLQMWESHKHELKIAMNQAVTAYILLSKCSETK
jgi:hypothetical protein